MSRGSRPQRPIVVGLLATKSSARRSLRKRTNYGPLIGQNWVQRRAEMACQRVTSGRTRAPDALTPEFGVPGVGGARRRRLHCCCLSSGAKVAPLAASAWRKAAAAGCSTFSERLQNHRADFCLSSFCICTQRRVHVVHALNASLPDFLCLSSSQQPNNP